MLGGDDNEYISNGIRFSIGDLKPEHTIMTFNGLYFIDLETFSFASDERLDVASLWVNTIGVVNTKYHLGELIDLYFSSLSNSIELDNESFYKEIESHIIPYLKDNLPLYGSNFNEVKM